MSSCSQLTSLSLTTFHFEDEEPWNQLAQLTNLKQLSLQVAASGDPSPLSALTGLSSLEFGSRIVVHGGMLIPYTFSRLQPLSTLQQLQELVLRGEACSATSLHGLSELSKLKTLKLDAVSLKSLEGLSTGLTSLTINWAIHLHSLAGIKHLQGLRDLTLCHSGITSLQPLAALSSLGYLRVGGKFISLAGLESNLCTSLCHLKLEECEQLRELSGLEGLTALHRLVLYGCGVTSLQPIGQLLGGLRYLVVHECSAVQEEVLALPHIQPTADVRFEGSNVKEVVLAGGVRRRVGAQFIDSNSEDEEEGEASD